MATASSTGAPIAHAFDPANWLSRFESAGGGYTVTETALHLFVANCPAPTSKCTASLMLDELLPDDHAKVQRYLENNQDRSTGISSRPADGRATGPTPAHQPEGNEHMNMMTRLWLEESAEYAAQEVGLEALLGHGRRAWDAAIHDLENDALIEAAFARRHDAWTAYNALPQDDGPIVEGMTAREKECWAIIDETEHIIRTTTATTPHGVMLQLWCAMYHTASSGKDDEAIHRGDFAAVAQLDSGLDWSARLMLAALHSLQTMGGVSTEPATPSAAARGFSMAPRA